MAQARSDTPSSKAKGRIVEEIAAWLHDWPGVEVQKNARLSAVNDPGRLREIDVLLKTSMAGYLVQVAIECKNESARIGAGYIDAFIGKLKDVGIPPQQGIFISGSAYTKGAVRRARTEGVRTLLLKGLSVDGLKASIGGAAWQSVVFLMARVDEVTYFTKEAGALPHIPLFVDASGRLCGTVPHLIAERWDAGGIPVEPGLYDLTLPLPESWRPFVNDGQHVDLLTREVFAKVQVVAFTHTFEGRAEQFSLANTETSRTEKLGVRAFFDTPGGRFPFARFETKAELDAHLATRRGLTITTRVKVPKIHYLNAYWPLSRRAADRIAALASVKVPVPGTEVTPFSTEEVEGLDIAAAWQPPLPIDQIDELFLGRLRRRGVSTEAPPP